jgi:multiple sugar transport system permease protein
MTALADDATRGSGPAVDRSGEAVAAYLLSAPAALLMLVLLFGPVIAVFFIALTDWQLGAPAFQFIGLANFAALLQDEGFRISLLNTFVYVLLVVPATVVLGLAVALLIDASPRFNAIYRAAHFLPVMATLAAMALAWEALLHPTIGLVNQGLGLIGISRINWLRNTSTVLPVLAVIGIWSQLGYAMVLYIAGLRMIPQDLYDAAEIDGADGMLDRLRTVTLPMLGPATMFVLIVIALKSFQVFDTVRVLTDGGPARASEVLLYTLYAESFAYMRTGYGAAVTVVFLLIIVSLTLLQARLLDKRVHYT